MEAADRQTVSEIVVRHIECTCRTAIDGRRAARALAEWTDRFALGEAEFQLLWCLRSAAEVGLDQTTLACRLAMSPAQISSLVERVCARDWIYQKSIPGDRRRRLWQLSTGGRILLTQMVAAASHLRCDAANSSLGNAREVAA